MESKTKGKKAGTREASQPAKDLVPQAEVWQSFYAVAQHWQSDLKFFENELDFFAILIDKNLVALIEPKNLDQTRTMVSHLKALEKDRERLHKKVSQHVEHITLLVENPFPQDMQKLKVEHEKLEKAFAELVKTFRSIKTEVFRLTEQVLHSERARRLIDWA